MRKENILLTVLVVYIIAGGLLITINYYYEPREGTQTLDEKCEEAGYIPPRNYHQLSQ